MITLPFSFALSRTPPPPHPRRLPKKKLKTGNGFIFTIAAKRHAQNFPNPWNLPAHDWNCSSFQYSEKNKILMSIRFWSIFKIKKGNRKESLDTRNGDRSYITCCVAFTCFYIASNVYFYIPVVWAFVLVGYTSTHVKQYIRIGIKKNRWGGIFLKF